MNFQVHINTKRKRKLLFGRIICIFMLLILLRFLFISFIFANFHEEWGTFWFLLCFTGVIVFFFFLSFYFERYPRILVEDDKITIYPLFRKEINIIWQDITSRSVKMGYTDKQVISSVISTWGGILGSMLYHSLSKIKTTNSPQVYAWEYTYYKDDKKLIRIVSTEMENAEYFDNIVCEHIGGEYIKTNLAYKNKEWEEKINKRPTLLLWLGWLILLFVFLLLTELARMRH